MEQSIKESVRAAADKPRSSMDATEYKCMCKTVRAKLCVVVKPTLSSYKYRLDLPEQATEVLPRQAALLSAEWVL